MRIEFKRPGTASTFKYNDGRVHECKTSKEFTSIRILLPYGSTKELSTDKHRSNPFTIYESKSSSLKSEHS